MSVLFETSLGDIVIDLEVESCSKTCENFLKLCKVYYYNLNAFFNGMPLFMSHPFTSLSTKCFSFKRFFSASWRPDRNRDRR